MPSWFYDRGGMICLYGDFLTGLSGISEKEKNMIRILFQGDSITDGNRYKDPSSRWDLNHQIGHSYVFNITGILGRRAPGK